MELDDLQGSFQPKPFYELFPVVSLESVTPWHYNYLFFFLSIETFRFPELQEQISTSDSVSFLPKAMGRLLVKAAKKT